MARYAGSLKPDFGCFKDAEGHYDHQATEAAETKWLEKLKEELRAKSEGDLVGERVKWSAADGYAVYIITKQRPLTLAHVALGDAYQANGATIRGFRLQDAKAQVRADRKWQTYMDEKARAHEDFYAGLSVGDVVHYHNSFGEFIRCKVVVAGENEKGHPGLVKGEKCLRPIELVGAWRSYDLLPTSYHVRQIREGEVCKPGHNNVYEADATLQKEHGDPAKMEAIVIKGQVEMFA